MAAGSHTTCGLKIFRTKPLILIDHSFTVAGNTWSMGIAINVVREMRRDVQRRENEDRAREIAARKVAADLPDNDATRSEHASLLRAGLDELPDRQREAIVLRFFEDKSVEETAAAMSCAEGTVKATVHQALRTLRNKLKQLS